MEHFADKLIQKIQEKGSIICVGLDPRLSQIPKYIQHKYVKKYKNPFKAASGAIFEFNKGILDAVYDLVPVVKPQIAFYEMYGHDGIQAFEDTIRYAHTKGLLVIADVKRNDIGSTAEAYAKGFLGKIEVFGEKLPGFDVDAITVTPYLGFDGIKPFLGECRKYGKGIFVLLKTSNPSSVDLQDICTIHGGKSNYELMAQYIESWGADDFGKNGYSFVGAVVGATFPKVANKLRRLIPRTFFLVPGYGAQGGSAKDVQECLNKDGLGAIVNSSRDIIFAYEKSRQFGEHQYAEAAREAVLRMKEKLRTC